MTDLIWKDQTLNTYGDIMLAISKITTKEEAAEFLNAYRATNPNADRNIGYLTGYLSDEEAKRIQELFKVEHPIFGGLP